MILTRSLTSSRRTYDMSFSKQLLLVTIIVLLYQLLLVPLEVVEQNPSDCGG